MSRSEWQQFVLTGTRTGKLAVTRSNGAPHVTPVWFVLDAAGEQDFVIFNTGKDSVKGKALARDPRFGLAVDDQAPPFSFALLEAEAELIDDQDQKLAWATRIGARYMGADQGEDFGKRNAVPEEYLVRGRITRVTALADLTA
ncbi:MAG TPA: PPOX class F420-dependent oxidoreductase [Pseudonocardiaceae bacterium]|jgi:PPOX class probable F420-dependent enzyme|nr:PPOX class F420-dependent oxidoreductase [Pseudonocardiaceae bacterium]